MEQQNRQPWVLVRGAGDLATGVIVRLHWCGFRVVVTECACPSAIRRKAALCEAVWQDTAQVEGVTARRIADTAQAAAVDAAGEIPLIVDEQAACVAALRPAAVVDAILAKRNLGTSRDMAPITVGLGPGFTAGQDVDAVIETMRGHHLGRVIRQGAALPNTGVPGVIAGYAAERVIHAPDSGAMHFVTDAAGKTHRHWRIGPGGADDRPGGEHASIRDDRRCAARADPRGVSGDPRAQDRGYRSAP